MRHWLLERLAEFGQSPAIIWRERDHGYRDLLKMVDRWGERLADCGVREGECIALHGDYSPGACSLLLALILNRNVVVPLGPGAVGDHEPLLQVGRVDAVFTFDALDTWTFRRAAAAGDHPLFRQLRDAREPGLVLFTSGSTGEKKAVLLGFDRLLERFRKRRRPFRTLVFMGPDHIGGSIPCFTCSATAAPWFPRGNARSRRSAGPSSATVSSSCRPHPPS
jgi:acyl-coenzyme A synthetase/AMP-(fatty) acid ligase